MRAYVMSSSILNELRAWMAFYSWHKNVTSNVHNFCRIVARTISSANHRRNRNKLFTLTNVTPFPQGQYFRNSFQSHASRAVVSHHYRLRLYTCHIASLVQSLNKQQKIWHMSSKHCRNKMATTAVVAHIKQAVECHGNIKRFYAYSTKCVSDTRHKMENLNRFIIHLVLTSYNAAHPPQISMFTVW